MFIRYGLVHVAIDIWFTGQVVAKTPILTNVLGVVEIQVLLGGEVGLVRAPEVNPQMKALLLFRQSLQLLSGKMCEKEAFMAPLVGRCGAECSLPAPRSSASIRLIAFLEEGKVSLGIVVPKQRFNTVNSLGNSLSSAILCIFHGRVWIPIPRKGESFGSQTMGIAGSGVPFAEEIRFIPRFLQLLEVDRGGEWDVALVVKIPMSVRISAAKQTPSCRTAQGGDGIRSGEGDSLGSQGIPMGSQGFLPSIPSMPIVKLMVCYQHENVWLAFRHKRSSHW